MNTRLLKTLLLVTGYLFSPAVFSGDYHSHDSHEHEHEHEKENQHLKTAYTSSKQAWQTLIEVVTTAEKNIASGNFSAVDEQNHTLEELVDYLQHQKPVTDTAQQKRLEGALKQLDSAITELHEQGHNPTQEGLTKTMKKVRGAMKMVEAQHQ